MQNISILNDFCLLIYFLINFYIGEYLDILAISCDSFDEEINRKIGRHHSKEKHLNILRRVRDWCIQYQVAFKINTVVNSYNRDEDMSEAIIELNPMRWKVGQLDIFTLQCISFSLIYMRSCSYIILFHELFCFEGLTYFPS